MILMLTLFEEEKQPAQVWTLDNDHDVKNVNCLWTTSPGMTMIMMLTLFEDEKKNNQPRYNNDLDVKNLNCRWTLFEEEKKLWKLNWEFFSSNFVLGPLPHNSYNNTNYRLRFHHRNHYRNHRNHHHHHHHERQCWVTETPDSKHNIGEDMHHHASFFVLYSFSPWFRHYYHCNHHHLSSTLWTDYLGQTEKTTSQVLRRNIWYSGWIPGRVKKPKWWRWSEVMVGGIASRGSRASWNRNNFFYFNKNGWKRNY